MNSKGEVRRVAWHLRAIGVMETKRECTVLCSTLGVWVGSGKRSIISAREATAMSERSMPKKSSRKMDDDLRPEYDFRALRVVARGPGRKATNEVTVRLAPDVAETFPDSDSVNEALRFLIRIVKGQMNTGNRFTYSRPVNGRPSGGMKPCLNHAR